MADELLQMFQSITTSDHDELVDQFAYLLQLDHDTATFFLESCNWNVEVAVNNYLVTMEAQESGGAARRAGGSGPRSDDLDMEDDNGAQQQQQQQNEPSALFVSDLTQSQTALLPPGAVVNMVWSFVNPGEEPWPEPTLLVFAQGESFDGPQQIQVAAAPRERIDVHASLRMPTAPGSFAGSWRLRSPHGFFGDPVWVILNVGAAPSAETLHHDPSKLAFQPMGQAPVGFGGAAGDGTGASAVVGTNDIEDMDL
ncbi:hypothetical protein PybrP1_002867 [[Pythium] brassicae (nom. inval.)]|nr:hypothetical protein PybrP1_002867 [[Pythium] brassicae (nom. inval.)]